MNQIQDAVLLVRMSVAAAIFASFTAFAGPQQVLWTDPGPVETFDFTAGAGGSEHAPKPPFDFIREETGGTSPKVLIRDARNMQWRVKGGLEVRAETFVTRFIGALGYFTEKTYFMASGKIEGITALKRASGFVKPDGSFTFAAFERLEPDARFLDDVTWTWNQSPFKGTPELQALKILMMLVSNWDNKDARDRRRGSNTSVLEIGGPTPRHVYFVNDWGQTMGRWGYGGYFSRRNMWDCRGFTEQTKTFVTGMQHPFVRFGYIGQHTNDFKQDITVDHVRWLMQHLGRITDAQIRTGLLSSGASKDDGECFAKALRARVEQLRKIAVATASSQSR